MAKPLPQIILTKDEKKALNRIINKRTSPQGLVTRARIVMLADKNVSTDDIMSTLSISKSTVVKWRRNFINKRLESLSDAPRPGDNGVVTKSKTLEQPDHGTNWSTREMAKEFGKRTN